MIPGGRIRAKELAPIGDFLGGDQTRRRGPTDGLGDPRFAIWHRFPGIGEHCPGRQNVHTNAARRQFDGKVAR